jgi:hypothetical protein
MEANGNSRTVGEERWIMTAHLLSGFRIELDNRQVDGLNRTHTNHDHSRRSGQ